MPTSHILNISEQFHIIQKGKTIYHNPELQLWTITGAIVVPWLLFLKFFSILLTGTIKCTTKLI